MEIKKILEAIKEMKVVELNELVKAIEEEFGVTAAALTVAATAPAEESSEKTVKMTSAGANKISIIKLIREIKGLGLMEAKQFVETTPAIIDEGISPEKAEELANKFKEAGAEIVIE